MPLTSLVDIRSSIVLALCHYYVGMTSLGLTKGGFTPDVEICCRRRPIVLSICVTLVRRLRRCIANLNINVTVSRQQRLPRYPSFALAKVMLFGDDQIFCMIRRLSAPHSNCPQLSTMSVNGFQIVTKIGGPQSSSAEIVSCLPKYCRVCRGTHLSDL
jgi:hypothetical protein